MTFFPIHSYRLSCPDNYDLNVLDNCINRIQNILLSDSTPVLTLNHLSLLTGHNILELKKIINRQKIPYKTIYLTKKNGSQRKIYSPEADLLKTQQWILSNILNNKNTGPFSHAYVKNRSIVTCMTPHLNARWLFKVDLKDFFGTITEDQVYEVFRGLGYSNLVSFELARICTVTDSIPPLRFKKTPRSYSEGSKKLPFSIINGQGYLPQGAPTSGYLSNLVFKEIDKKIYEKAIKYNFVYSRYSDDLIFSAISTSIKNINSFIRDLDKDLKSLGFELNYKKIRIMGPGRSKIALGLNVTGSQLLPTPSYTRNIKFHIWACNKFGIMNHVERTKFYSLHNFQNFIEGSLAFGLGVNRETYSKLQKKWDEIKSNSPIALL